LVRGQLQEDPDLQFRILGGTLSSLPLQFDGPGNDLGIAREQQIPAMPRSS
jgi:hypothetical protein